MGLHCMVPAIRCRYTPTLNSYETPWVPIYKMSTLMPHVQPNPEAEPFWDEEEEEDDEPAAKRPRLV